MAAKAKKKLAKNVARNLTVACFEGLEGRRLLTTSVWVGTAGDHLFSNPANWQDDTVPASGNDLQFNDLGTPETVDFDISGINAGNIYVSNAYTFTGNDISLLGDVNVGTNSSATFNNTIDIAANVNFDADTGGTITLGTLADSTADSLTKYGTGTIVFDGNSSSNWALITGTMTLNTNTQIELSEYGGQGAILNGSGSVASLSNNAGDVTPTNASGPTTIGGTNNIYFDGGNLNAEITNAGHSELTASSGTVTLDGSPNLKLTLGSGFATTNGSVYTLISNGTGTAVSGTFNNLPEGATVTADGEAFRISYVGGTSGHDVTLTSVAAAPTITVSSSATTTIVGASTTLTAHVAGTDGTPTGAVTFYSGGTALGTANLSGGVASLATTSLPAGTDSVTAVYAGNSTYTSVTSAANTVSVSSTGPVISSTSSIYETAKSIKLTATGLDTSTTLTDGLTYTWTTLKAPSGAKPIKFSVNGDHDASTTIAAISKDGTYDFDVTAKDSAGHAYTMEVQFYARQIARYLDIAPTTAKVTEGHHVLFSASALDQFDHAMRVNSTSTVYALASGYGSTTSAGLFTASSTKTGKSVVKVTLDGLTGDADVTVEA